MGNPIVNQLSISFSTRLGEKLTTEAMASALGMGRRAAKRAVRELRARGLIRPINGERGAYLIAPRSKWRAILARRGGLSQW